MANKVTVKCDGVEEKKSLTPDVNTIFKLRQLLEQHSKKYPVVLHKGKKVSRLQDPIPTDRNELLHFISKIDIKDPQGGNVPHELTETVADVIKRYTRQNSKFGLIIISGGKTKKPKPNKKLSEIYKPGVSLKLYESITYTCTIKSTTFNFVIKVEIDKKGKVKDLVNEALGINEDISDNEDEGVSDNEDEGLKYEHVQVKSDNAVTDPDLNTKLSNFEEDTMFDISYNHDPTDEEKIKIMKQYTNPPSKYGSKKNKSRNLQLSLMKVPICDHREGRVGDDVILYYQGFQRFVDNCNDIKLSTKDLDFAQTVCTEMSQYFPDEKERENAFANTIKKCFELGNDDVVQSEPPKSVADIVIGPNSCVIIEVKNESGQGGGSDSHSQVIAYYIQSLEKRKQDQCPSPAYLIELVGPQLTISGAVYGRYVFVDKLIDPIWLVPQHNKETIFKIARIFKALKDAIRGIRSYYTVLPQIHMPRYPTITLHEVDDKKAEISITYTKRIQANMFEGKRDGDPQNHVIVHFVENYNRDVHNLMHKNGLAPEILIYAKAKGTRYKAIIMKRIDDATSFADYLKKYPNEKEVIFKECEKALATMHREGLCHGNFAHESIFIQQPDKIFVVNFQFSGKFREERHGMIITPEDDDASLKELLGV